jgi:hypothetical protein
MTIVNHKQIIVNLSEQDLSVCLGRPAKVMFPLAVGIADIEAGRYRTFDSPADLDHHLGTLRDIALSPKGRGESGR